MTREDGAVVLVVDDDDACRHLVEQCLACVGIASASASSTRTAIALLQERTFDAVVTDHDMPGGDGLALARFLRARPDLAELPVIMVSGHADPALERALAALGGALLRKPVDVEALLATVQRALGRPAGSAAAE